ncbi:Uncharacterized protein OBRU01_09374 [Operophtera brumata]|uniref:Retrotransposon gag domain-containing protein n=1 Tax=Operophtera brumata TaxID=104452 RepID=A0A0L7L3K4_OPEBR|nr:Uncharacterized protein OBRU01_09374 [Operophtera brumata]
MSFQYDSNGNDSTNSANGNAFKKPDERVIQSTSAQQSDSNDESNTSSSGGVQTELLKKMMQIMNHMTDRITKLPDNKVKINDVFLPSYDPDANIGIREWCQHVTAAMETYKLSNYDIRMKASSLLQGRARLWVDNWLVTTTTWQELREVLITTFEPENRYSRDILRFREHTYDETKDIAQFLSQAWVQWKRITKGKLSDNDAVEAVIGCIGDERLRIELLNARAGSVPELISVASSIRCVKRPHLGTPTEEQGPAKRPRF